MQNQLKMLVFNKQVMLSVDINFDKFEVWCVIFFIGCNNIFYLEMVIDWIEFIKLNDFDLVEVFDLDELIVQVNLVFKLVFQVVELNDYDDLFKFLGM